MRAIYIMGFDVWGVGMSEVDYLIDCESSEKYKLGTWFCLEHAGLILSSLIVYENCFELADRYCGLGSLSTHKQFRKNGYAGVLVQQCIEKLKKSNYLGLLLFSDIGPDFYEKFGFKVIEKNEHNVLMYLDLNGGVLPELPRYF